MDYDNVIRPILATAGASALSVMVLMYARLIWRHYRVPAIFLLLWGTTLIMSALSWVAFSIDNFLFVVSWSVRVQGLGRLSAFIALVYGYRAMRGRDEIITQLEDKRATLLNGEY